MQMQPGQRLTAGQEIRAHGMTLAYQGDGNLVLYDRRGRPVWATDTPGRLAGSAEMQGDGFLVLYDAAGVPYWRSGDVAIAGGRLLFDDTGLRIMAIVDVPTWQARIAPPDPGELPPAPVRQVRPLVGPVRPLGRSFGDATGPRIVHGCSDFGAIKKFHENRDKALGELDIIAAHQQFVRVLWRLNGRPWAAAGMSVDPIRDPWFDDALHGYLMACHERGLRVKLASGDFYNWSRAQARESFARVASIAASVSTEVVWLSAVANEMRGTMPGKESDENIAWMAECLQIWQQHYPWSLRAGSDPGSQDKAGMQRLAPSPANVALIHDVRWGVADAIRRAFNTPYENWPGISIAQAEPTGPNGSPPHNPFTRQVYQPTEDHDDLLAIYTMHVITGQASVYFNDPALVSREPIDSTWGFKELPAAWRAMEIPEHIGQGTLKPGHHGDAPLLVTDSGAERADSMVLPDYAIGVISGGERWRVRAGRSGEATAFTAAGVVWEGRVSRGQVLPIVGPTPTIVRFRS